MIEDTKSDTVEAEDESKVFHPRWLAANMLLTVFLVFYPAFAWWMAALTDVHERFIPPQIVSYITLVVVGAVSWTFWWASEEDSEREQAKKRLARDREIHRHEYRTF